MATTIKAGSHVQVRAGITAPDLPDFPIGGWTGKVTEVKGRADKQRFFVEWDEQTLAKMSPEYLQQCEAKQLFHLMSCFPASDIESVGG